MFVSSGWRYISRPLLILNITYLTFPAEEPTWAKLKTKNYGPEFRQNGHAAKNSFRLPPKLGIPLVSAGVLLPKTEFTSLLWGHLRVFLLVLRRALLCLIPLYERRAPLGFLAMWARLFRIFAWPQ